MKDYRWYCVNCGSYIATKECKCGYVVKDYFDMNEVERRGWSEPEKASKQMEYDSWYYQQ